MQKGGIEMDFKSIVESDRAHLHTWSDVSELNYWARKIGFQRGEHRLIEIR